jgi:autotransporter-associated beta strand protein
LNGAGRLDISNLTNGGMTAGSIEGDGNISLGSNTLTVGGNNRSTLLSGVVDGNPASRLSKSGSGTLTLTGTSTLTGDVTVDGGTLLVNGSIASAAVARVNAGAILGGTGIVPGTLVGDHGTVAPGTPLNVGMLTVNTSLIFCGCSNFAVKVTATSNDLARVVVGTGLGDAVLGGTLAVSSPNSSYRFGSPYTVLTAEGSFSGSSFTSLSLPTGLNGSLNYTVTATENVLLTLSSNLGGVAGLGVNQRAVASVLDAALNAQGVSGSFGAVYGGEVGGKLGQLAGEGAASTVQTAYAANGLFMTTLLNPSTGGRYGTGASPSAYASDGGEALAYAGGRKAAPRELREAYAAVAPRDARPASFDARWNVWAAGYGGAATVSGDAVQGSSSTSSRIYGTAVGADYRVSRDTLLGFALGGAGTSFSTTSLVSGRADLFQAGVYGRHSLGAAYLAGALAYGWQDVATRRTVTVAGTDTLEGRFKANTLSARGEAGYRYATPLAGLTPYGALQFTSIHLPGYSETATVGSNQFALAYAAQTSNNLRSEVGLRADKSFATADGILTLRGRAAWAHDSNPNRAVSSTFKSLPGSTSFVVNGAASPQDIALLTAGAEIKWRNGCTVAAGYEGELSRINASHAGKATVRNAW